VNMTSLWLVFAEVFGHFFGLGCPDGNKKIAFAELYHAQNLLTTRKLPFLIFVTLNLSY
jgi:hypothetical protein